MDDDVDQMDHEALVTEVKKLRAGIREHRDSSGQELCWHHPKLWGLLPDRPSALPVIPAWAEFLHGCIQYRESLDRQIADAPRRAIESYLGIKTIEDAAGDYARAFAAAQGRLPAIDVWVDGDPVRQVALDAFKQGLRDADIAHNAGDVQTAATRLREALAVLRALAPGAP